MALTVSPPYMPPQNLCSPNACGSTIPDFKIKQHDTKPPFKFSVTDINGDPIDLTGLVLEAAMFFKTCLKNAISATDTGLQFMNCVGFNQVLVDDIIIVDRPRSPENMLVVSIDEDNKIVYVNRGVNGTVATSYKKGQAIKIFRFMGSPGQTEMVYEDIPLPDGNILCNQLIESFLVYNFSSRDTCLPGCYCFEFKLLTMNSSSIDIPSVIPQCFIGVGVESVQRYPNCGYFSILICESPTAEL